MKLSYSQHGVKDFTISRHSQDNAFILSISKKNGLCFKGNDNVY